MLANKKRIIILNKAEVQSGLNRQKAAEGLILQLHKDHDGRNSWLLNYGVKEEAQAIRKKHNSEWNDKTESAFTVGG